MKRSAKFPPLPEAVGFSRERSFPSILERKLMKRAAKFPPYQGGIKGGEPAG